MTEPDYLETYEQPQSPPPGPDEVPAEKLAEIEAVELALRQKARIIVAGEYEKMNAFSWAQLVREGRADDVAVRSAERALLLMLSAWGHQIGIARVAS